MGFISHLASLIFKTASKFKEFENMTAEQLLALSNADLVMAVMVRTDSGGNAAVANTWLGEEQLLKC
jgi:hypothetical protein